MPDKKAPDCDVDDDQPARITKRITEKELTDGKIHKIERMKTDEPWHTKLPREVRYFEWKTKCKVLPTRQRLHRFGITRNSRCLSCKR
ncbi:hypothetical protein MTO96_029557 [Rhipicephalus appendiculatus]